MSIASRALSLVVLTAAVWPLGGCSVDVQEDGFGSRKDVDIRTPVGAMSVRTGVDADTGLPVFPGATPLRGDDEPESATVNIGSGLFGLNLAAAKFETDAEPDAVIRFYRDAMNAYGDVLQCEGDVDFRGRPGRQRPVCKERGFSSETQLVVGTEERHRLVSVKARRGGAEFAVVSIATRGQS